MTTNAWLQLGAYVLVLVLVCVPLGRYMARVYAGEAAFAARILGPLERALYRAAGIDPGEQMTWPRYAAAVLLFNAFGMLLVYVLLRVQNHLPLNPNALTSVSPAVAFNTAASFVTNTDFQAYAGETSITYLSQMLALTVQSFLSAATGMAVLVALVRGLDARGANGLGSFWVDLTRSTLYVLLPLSLVLAVLLVSEGVVQTFSGHATARLLEDTVNGAGDTVTQQIIARGPAASQIAIKQLGTNGGGFFNANSAHPFENPSAFSGFLELLAILLVPAALCSTFGALVKDPRQGRTLFAAMLVIFVPLVVACVTAEQHGNPALTALGVDQSGGNMEGKEVRFGIAGSALWTVATTSASNGSVNAMLDSFTPLGGGIAMWLMQLGEVVFGGAGSGLYGMLMYALVAVFLAGLIVGRTPEYLGKKIEAFEMKMASLVILIPSAAVLVGTAIACSVPAGMATLGNPGAHGFSEILYAFSSGANNNGSAFGGLSASGTFYATAIGLCMLVGRFGVIVPVLALASSLARKRPVPASAGTLPTHTPLFVGLLVFVVLLVGALTFIPSLALGPVVEHLTLHAR